MSKTLDKFITADNNLLVLLDANSGVSTFSFATVMGAPVRIASASISLVFLSVMEFLKRF